MPVTAIPEIISIFRRDPRAIGRAATLLERGDLVAQELISYLFPSTGQAKIIGVTGPAGVGKSTLINSYIRQLRSQDRTVGVIAIDPSSSISSGALLGDRIRMLEHAGDSAVFIRSCATRGVTGGLAASTMNLSLLLDAAGFDFVIIETVGVGQDEVDIVRLADVTVLVLAPDFGDGVQAIKAGIMEIASVFVINKADQPGADSLADEIRFSQSLAASDPHAPICQVIAKDNVGTAELQKTIASLADRIQEPGTLEERWKQMLTRMVKEKVVETLDSAALMHHATLVSQRRESPYAAAEALVEALKHPGTVRER